MIAQDLPLIDPHRHYDMTAPAALHSPEMLRRVQRNALEMEFLEPGETQALLRARSAA